MIFGGAKLGSLAMSVTPLIHKTHDNSNGPALFSGDEGFSDFQVETIAKVIAELVEFCISVSREEVRSHDGSSVNVITALAPLPHPRFSRFFTQIKQDLGFGIYVPDCDTTACSFSAATQAGSTDPILDQPLLDFYAGYQVREGANEPVVTVPLNDNIDFEGGVATWIDNLRGDRPFGNDLDPTLNLDILEVSFRNIARWKVLETRERLETVQRIRADMQRVSELRRKVAASPREASLRCEVGLIFLRNGQAREGLRWLHSALQLDPGHAEARPVEQSIRSGIGRPAVGVALRRPLDIRAEGEIADIQCIVGLVA